MERIQSINPKRIVWCCEERGIALDQLSTDLSIAATTLKRVLDGAQGLTFGQLGKLSDYFGRGVLFFLEPEPVDEKQVHTAQFRTIANQKPELSPKIKALIERAERQRDVYLSLREDLDDEEWQRFNPPNVAGLDPRGAAEVAREWLGLQLENTFETYRVTVESCGLLVFRSNGYSGKWQIAKDSPILGFSLYDPLCPLIVLKKQNAETRQTFTLMHELGHVLLHKTSSIDDENDLASPKGFEREANAFAGYVLVPDTFLDTINDADRPTAVSEYDAWLVEHRVAWGVSGEVILRRLLDAGRLTQPSYVAYREWQAQRKEAPRDAGNRMYRHREPKHVFGDTYVRTVLDALNARHITVTRASSYLDSLKLNDLHRLEEYYADL